MPEIPVTVPDALPRTVTSGDYPWMAAGSAAACKLASSAVAPLVARARGYEAVEPNPVNRAARLREVGLGGVTPSSRQGRALASSLKDGDVLVMPWFVVTQVMSGDCQAPATVQYRPERPRVSAEGRVMKYEFVSGTQTPLGAHPALPAAWLSGEEKAARFVFTEGLLKGDAALSGMLAAAGVGWDELAVAGDVTVAQARERLTALLHGLPRHRRCAILTVAGVDNWKRNTEWATIDLAGCEAVIAFDADVAVNPQVWRAADSLWTYLAESRKADRVSLMSPVVTGEGGELVKAGVDDYLALHGTWDRLLAGLADEMPPRPAAEGEGQPGDWVVCADGMGVEEIVAVKDERGQVSGTRRVPRVALAARVKSTTHYRPVTARETATGVFDAHLADAGVSEVDVEIEFAFSDQGQAREPVAVLPETVLSTRPAEWAKAKGGLIPSSVQRHPDWPIFAGGEKWLRAVKAHRHEEMDRRTVMTQMGWAPDPQSPVPVFLIGQRVIGDQGEQTRVACGADRLLHADKHDRFGASRMGTGEDPARMPAETVGDFTSQEYLRRVADDLDDYVRRFLADRPWQKRGYGHAVVFAGLRPAIPLPTRLSLFSTGPAAKGKSLTAAAIQAHTAAAPSSWTRNRLPGAARDTETYTEAALHVAPIWVMDDLAPSDDPRQARSEQAKVANVIRSVFNQSGKGRGQADGSLRQTRTPRAVLVVTAENDLTVTSAQGRAVTLRMVDGALHPDRAVTDRLEESWESDDLPARVLHHLVCFIRHKARTAPGGWAGMYSDMEERLSEISAEAQHLFRERMPAMGALQRGADIAAELLLVGEILAEMAETVDVTPAELDMVEITESILAVVAASHASTQERTPGRSLMTALTSLLASGKAHLGHITDPADVPVTLNADIDPDGKESAAINAHLGWIRTHDGWKPGPTPRIGVVAETDVLIDGRPQRRHCVLFFKDVAFAEARRAYPDLIPPGQGARSSWGAFWDEGFADPMGWSARYTPQGTRMDTIQVCRGAARPSGVPCPLTTLLTALAGETI